MSPFLRLVPFGLFAGLALLLPAYVGDGTLHFFTEVLVVVLLASMWNLLAGYAGLMSLGHQAYFGIGAYTLFVFSNLTGLHPFLALPLSALISALVAAVIAPLLFRLRDAYFAIGSWVIAEVISILVQKTDALGGITGISLINIGLIDFASFERHIFWLASAAAIFAVAGSFLWLRTRFGLALTCVRDNETAAASIGINVWSNRFVAYVVSAAGVGLAGALGIMSGLAVQPGNVFSPEWTVVMSFVVIVGGIGTLEGPIVGAIIYFVLRHLLTVVFPLTGTWYLVAMGAVAVATMLWAPRGLWPTLAGRLRIGWLQTRRLVASP